SDPLVWRKDLDPALKKKIGDWLFGYGKTESEKQILAALQWAPFKKSDNNQLLPIRQMEVNRTLMKLKGDETVPEAEKAPKLSELQKKSEELGQQIEALKK